ncbi:BirA family biotin operon repressor/biotin-[acetyl-CoA-carboxylase] ligase [Tenacibaculum gallaicum]|uniref:BirA family biotin operon repressor/biotin-[acetyl-CoA-carboxylase] ligase n=1 Tax=Tenacibaculum gallaicum TaxID=561505 RepID=A0A3E0I1S6_9FLAO|nr:biotin--[acetyl-CoA-carboxylase] ligase [Tenacibaculum gallaicum]REH52551.1 BirA family biotin operon repressor/biotin-[acetyl-CoA-carboxylase] ligase [Tenacibaculum gallaicum]
MKIIKLNAIDSTNTFLKNMVSKVVVDDFTVVVTKTQTKGRGQMNSDWVVEEGKNLTFSVFSSFIGLKVEHHKYLNFCVSLSVFEALEALELPNLSVKWPNDILSGNKKLGGILIENTLKGSNIVSSVIGIGINVNQNSFPNNLPNASSVKKILGREFDLDVLLENILKNLKGYFNLLERKEYNLLEEAYLKVLYKKNVPTMFKNSQNTLFMGKIIGVSKSGNLQIELENETIQEFGLKEVSFATL